MTDNEHKSNYPWWVGARNRRSRILNLSDYDRLSLDAALTIGYVLAKEVTFHIAQWNLSGQGAPFLPHISGMLSTMESINADHVDGLRSDVLVDHTRNLFDKLGRIGSMAFYFDKYVPVMAGVGERFQDIGYFVSTTSEILPSQVHLPLAAYATARDGYNKMAADVLLDDISLGSGRKLSEEFLLNHTRLQAGVKR